MTKTNYRSIIACIGFYTLLGCSEKFNNNLTSAEFKVDRRGIADYNVVIETPKNEYLSIIRKVSNTGESFEVARDQTGIIIDNNISSGETYIYSVGSLSSSGRFTEYYSRTIKVPFDVISSKTQLVPKYYYSSGENKAGEYSATIDTLVLEKGYPFYLNIGSSSITINKLISSDGELITFHPESKAIEGVRGLSGGPLNLTINEVAGTFKIKMIGQIGGMGLRPPPLGEEGKGIKGSVGSDGLELHVTFKSVGDTEVTCSAQPGVGLIGGKGVQGLKGNVGESGGDSGELYLTLGDKVYNIPIIERIGGAGGSGSLGGEGGPGGYGGDPGKIVVKAFTGDPGYKGPVRLKNEPCNKATVGPTGPQGEAGPPGEIGAVGKIEKYCIKSVSEKDYKCIE